MGLIGPGRGGTDPTHELSLPRHGGHGQDDLGHSTVLPQEHGMPPAHSHPMMTWDVAQTRSTHVE